ncbi:MAG: methyltransferase domain-containing protein [Methylophaga sp.]|nr:methyltransferase domain-containing protein [Methylophaga sp.]
MSDSNLWEQRYQNGQTGWDRGETSANLLHWMELGLLKPCRILVPGCGNGHEVVTLASLGFDVVAIDIAPTPLAKLSKMLQKDNLGAELIQADFFTWQPDKDFDAIYEQTSLCALPPEQWRTYEKCLYKWLKSNGKLFAQFMQSTQEGGPPFHCELSDMLALFASLRWQWSEQYETQVIHSSGKYEKLYCLEKMS